MKTASNDLYKLIKSLSSHEKRLFKLFAGKDANSTFYIFLFNKINDAPEYNEKKLIEQVFKVYKTRNIKQTKKYLYESILTFLEAHYKEYSIDTRLNSYLTQAEVLRSKNLKEQALKIIVKAEKLAKENYRFLYQSIFQAWKFSLIPRLNNESYFKEYLKKEYADELRNATWQNNTIEIRNLMAQEGLQTGLKPGSEEQQELETILQHPLFINKNAYISPLAQIQVYDLKGKIYLKQFNLSGSEKYLEMACSTIARAIKLVESTFKDKRACTELYLLLLWRYTSALMILKKREEVIATHPKFDAFIESIPEKFRNPYLYEISIRYKLSLLLYVLAEHEIEEAFQLGKIIQPLVDKYQYQEACFFYISYFYVHFYRGDFQQALRCINKILKDKKTNPRPDIYDRALVLKLFVYYELKQFYLLPSTCKSTHYHLRKRGKITGLEKALLHLFNKAATPGLNEKNKQLHLIKTAEEEIQKIVADDSAGINLSLRSWCLLWLKSKRTNQSLVVLLKEKRSFHA